MTVKEIRFRDGVPISQSDQLSAVVGAHMNEAQQIFHPVGRHDVTPQHWTDPDFRYVIHVRDDGTGSLEMVPRYSESAFYEQEASRGFQIPEDPSKLMHSMIKPINKDSDIMIIAGGHRVHVLALYSLIYWVENTQAE